MGETITPITETSDRVRQRGHALSTVLTVVCECVLYFYFRELKSVQKVCNFSKKSRCGTEKAANYQQSRLVQEILAVEVRGQGRSSRGFHNLVEAHEQGGSRGGRGRGGGE